MAESFLKTEVNNAVITVPSNFTDSQRKALLDSARIAGLNCMSLLNDTTASAIAYAYDKKIENRDNILIFDLGAYYLNMSLVSIEKITENGQISTVRCAVDQNGPSQKTERYGTDTVGG